MVEQKIVKEIKRELRKLFMLRPTHYVVAEFRAICKTLENGTEVAGVTHVIQSCVSIITIVCAIPVHHHFTFRHH